VNDDDVEWTGGHHLHFSRGTLEMRPCNGEAAAAALLLVLGGHGCTAMANPSSKLYYNANNVQGESRSLGVIFLGVRSGGMRSGVA